MGPSTENSTGSSSNGTSGGSTGSSGTGGTGSGTSGSGGTNAGSSGTSGNGSGTTGSDSGSTANTGSATTGGGNTTTGGTTGGGNTTTGGTTGGGNTTTGGTTGGGNTTTGGTTGGGNTTTGGDPDAGELEPFSFFVASLESLRELSKNQSGFGGDLRFGETGAGAGLKGADKICATIADKSMPGASAKQWRAFLSAADDGTGKVVNAIERIGAGPWYDRTGRLVAKTTADLKSARPKGADTTIINDLPNEFGVPNHDPDGKGKVDNHHVLTGSNDTGMYMGVATATCKDWTSAVGADGKPRVGLSWPRGTSTTGSSAHWISAMNESGCAPGVSLVEMGGPDPNNPTVGSGGGYGAIYCFALTP